MLPDYSQITAASITKIVDDALDEADRIVGSIEAQDTGHTFASTLGALDGAAVVLSDAYGKGPFMARVHPDSDVRSRAVELEERVEKWRTNLVFRKPLYRAIAAFAATPEAADLGPIQRRLLDFWLRDFRRAGHELDDASQARLQRLQQRLVELEVQFAKNLDAYEDYLEVSEEDLAGLPEDYIARLELGETAGTRKVTMAYPDYRPFMEESSRRDLRHQLLLKFWNRAAEGNRPLLEEAVELRQKIAVLLGYATWAEYAMELKMAKHPKTVADFYGRIVPELTEKARTELTALQDRHQAELPGDTMQTWDWMYHHSLQRKEEYGVDRNEVAAYFELDSVIEGMFEITGEVFGLRYDKLEDASTWHPDVSVYAIHDIGRPEPIAYFYADLFPREGKYGHAAAFPIVVGMRQTDGRYRRPVSAIVANFTKPTEDRPSLLKHDEALTLFHEFGHILHSCLTTVDIARFSGFDTEWDFVEAPSQIMEHWMWRPEVLQRFAKHHETGAPIPEELVDRLVAARDQNVGLLTMRQVFLGQLDLAMHAVDGPKDLDEIYRRTYELTQLPFPEDTFFPASFGHLMGGYDAGYYGYLWAKVYGDDMFSVFDAEGVTSPSVGERYRDEVLATGGSRDAIEHLRAFLGREPSPDAFLANLGLSS